MSTTVEEIPTISLPVGQPTDPPANPGYGVRKRHASKPGPASRFIITPPGRQRSVGSPYRRGQFDELLGISTRPAPEEIRGLELRVSASGTGLVAHEISSNADLPSRPRLLQSYPYYVDLTLPNGDEISIEVTRYSREELAAWRAEVPAATEPEPEPAQLAAEPTAEPIARIMCALLRFEH